MSTYFETVENARKLQKWVIVDAADKVVGRLATEVAAILRGKRNTHYTPHVDTGDFVVIINAAKIRFTGSKPEKKTYYKHTGFIGGIRETNAGELLKTKPEEVIIHAVRGMLPKSALGRNQLLKLKIYRDADHPHIAQQPAAPKFGPFKQ